MFKLGNGEIFSKDLGVEIGIAGRKVKTVKGKQVVSYETYSPDLEARMYLALKNLDGIGVYKPTERKATWKLRPSMVKKLTEQAQAKQEQPVEA